MFYGKRLLNASGDVLGPTRNLHVLTECPRSYVSEQSREWIELFILYQTFKVLPEPGSLLDQPYIVMEALRICQEEVSAIDAHAELERQIKYESERQLTKMRKRAG